MGLVGYCGDDAGLRIDAQGKEKGARAFAGIVIVRPFELVAFCGGGAVAA